MIADVGGPTAILACGKPATIISFQSILAWETTENVADIGWNPPAEVRRGKPIVLVQPHLAR